MRPANSACLFGSSLNQGDRRIDKHCQSITLLSLVGPSVSPSLLISTTRESKSKLLASITSLTHAETRPHKDSQHGSSSTPIHHMPRPRDRLRSSSTQHARHTLAPLAQALQPLSPHRLHRIHQLRWPSHGLAIHKRKRHRHHH
jgi:hypothetical protein